MNFEGVNAALASDSILLIDVRNHSELNSDGQIPKSHCVPLKEIQDGAFQLNNSDFKQRYGFEKPTQSDRFVLTCRSGRRVLLAEKHLNELGYTNITTYLGSFLDWVANGGTVVKGTFDAQ